MILALLTLLAAVDPSGVVSIYGRGGMGSACPVSATEALTAEHVSSEEHGPGKHVPVPLIYSLDNKYAGLVLEVSADAARDLSRLKITSGDPFPAWYEIAKESPKKGDKVTLSGYDFNKGAVRNVVTAKVMNVDGPHVTYDRMGSPGSSGSCVLNEAGELIAINTGGFLVEREVGRGVSVWGRWLEFLVPEVTRNVPGLLEIILEAPPTT